MKELLSINSNFVGFWDQDNKIHAQVEVILVLSEPQYSMDHSGEMVRQRSTDSVRFAASPKALRKLASGMVKLADECDQLERGANQ